MRDPFPEKLQRELATIAASVITTSASTEPALMSAAAQTSASPNQVLALAIAKIVVKRLAREPSLPGMMLNGVMYEVANRALLVLEANDNAEDVLRQSAEQEHGVRWNDILGADIAYLVAKWFRGEPTDPERSDLGSSSPSS